MKKEIKQLDVNEIAKTIDHSILHPTHTDVDLERECMIAKKYNVASVCVKPYMVKTATKLLNNSDVKVGCVIGFPAGNSSISVKTFETDQACKDGATEIDMVINIAKVFEKDWDYLQNEIKSIVETAHKYNAITKVIIETDYVTSDEDKIKLCKIGAEVGAEYIKTSTGFGYKKNEQNLFYYEGANEHDIALMKKNAGPVMKVKASGNVKTLDQIIKYKELGASRCGATATESILEEAKKRFS